MGRTADGREHYSLIGYSKISKKSTIESIDTIVGDEVYEKMQPESKAKSDKANRVAAHLVVKFKAPGSLAFFRKCAWRLSEDEIWTTYELSQRSSVKNPLAYFIAVCSRKF